MNEHSLHQPGATFLLAQVTHGRDVGIEGVEIAGLALQQAFEAGDEIVVGSDGVEAGVVPGLGEGAVVDGVPVMLAANHEIVGVELREDRGFALAHLRRREILPAVDLPKLLAGGEKQADDLAVFGQSRFVPHKRVVVALREQPAADGSLGIGGGEGFVEIAVAGNEELHVREFVEDDFGKFGIGAVKKVLRTGS